MKSETVDAYAAVDCPFYRANKTMFVFVWLNTHGQVCDTGCAEFDNGKCSAYRKLIVPAKVEAQQEPQETVRETAKRLGISISEVRRRRKA